MGLKKIIIDINSRELIEEYIKNNLNISDDKILYDIFRAIDKVPKKGKSEIIEEYKKDRRECFRKSYDFCRKEKAVMKK